jgi:hypothetical protein
VAGSLLADPLAQDLLHRPVGLGHGRQVGLGLDDQVVGLEPLLGDGVGEVGQLEGEDEVRVPTGSLQGPACGWVSAHVPGAC